MADAIPPTSPTPVNEKRGTAQAPPANLGGTTVSVGGNPGDLQAAINAALNPDGTHKGDTLVVPAGVTYSQLIFPPTTGPGWTRIISSGNLPPDGTRVTPADTAECFQVVAGDTQRAISQTATFGSNGWIVKGMEAKHAISSFQFGLIDIWFSHRWILEHCYIHGFADQLLVRDMFIYGADDIQLWDCWISEAQNEGNSDSQAIFFRNNTRFHVENCQLEGAAECVILGDEGAATTTWSSDGVFRRNDFFKPIHWLRLLRDGSANPDFIPPPSGTQWSIKNNFEIKVGRRILVEGNRMTNCWPQGQDGTSILYNGGLSNRGLPTQDVMFRHNIVRNANGGISVNTIWDGMSHARLAFLNNMFVDIVGRFFMLLHKCDDVWIEHNTCIPLQGPNQGPLLPTSMFFAWDGPNLMPRLTVKHNAYARGLSGGVTAQGAQPTTAAFDGFVPDREFVANHEIGASSASQLAGVVFQPSASAAGINLSTGVLLTGSPLIGTAADGSDIGVNFDTLNAAQNEGSGIMAILNVAITNQVLEHTVNYTGVRVRFQRSTDGGVTFTDVQSATRALGSTADSYSVPVGQSGHYRAGAALTDGTVFGTEVFSNVIQLAVFMVSTPQTITLAIA